MAQEESRRRVVVGYSGGVTSARCLAWALAEFPRHEVIALFHDTRKEHPDTYRYLREMAAKLNVAITERSDGRSVEEVEDDERALANNRMAFCSRILKIEPRERYFAELRAEGVRAIIMALGFTAMESRRIQTAVGRADRGGYEVRFPLAENGWSKQDCADWSRSIGVRLPAMYGWSDHANCVGCRRGGRAYWLAVKENAPEEFAIMKQRESEFGHTVCKGISLAQLEVIGLRRRVERKESIDIGACECGD